MEEANFSFWLKDGSTCIGGDVDSVDVNGFWSNAPTIDFEGNPRPNPSGTSSDIGSFESNLSKALNN